MSCEFHAKESFCLESVACGASYPSIRLRCHDGHDGHDGRIGTKRVREREKEFETETGPAALNAELDYCIGSILEY